jgi:ribosomal-protein-alanine N-acetyltransferase
MATQRRGKPVTYDVDDREIRIRVAESRDLTEVGELDIEVFGSLAYPVFVLRQLFDVHLDCWLVAEHSTGLLGYSLGVPTTDGATGWILGLAVRPAFRRQHCGTRLTEASLRLLGSRKTRTAYLTVDPDNMAAVALYRKLGFTAGELFQDYLGPGEHRRLMTRDLRIPGS